MKVCAITCTGGRPELFALCQRWVERQTRKPDLWFVSTDMGAVTAALPPYAERLHFDVPVDAEPQDPDPHRRAQRRAYLHLCSVLARVPKDHSVVIMEDDDWYAANHIQTLVGHLERTKKRIAGHNVYRIYHVPSRAYLQRRCTQADIGTVALSPEGVSWYLNGLLTHTAGSWALDCWAQIGEKPECSPTSVGMKGAGYGLPGRLGASSKHTLAKALRCCRKDADTSVLRQWLGADADAYLALVQP